MLDFVFSPWAAGVVFVATRLRVFTLLHGHPMTASELNQHLQADQKLVTALLDACVALGFLHRERECYMNSHRSESHLVAGSPLYVGDIIEVVALESARWQRLFEQVVRSNQTGGMLEIPEAPPRLFTMAMDNIARQGEAAALAAGVDLAGCKTLIDVGCGSGAYSAALCQRYPEMRATLLDRPEVIDTTRQVVRSYGLGDRIVIRPSDITRDTYGTNADVVLLSDVLYQNKSASVSVLRSAHEALVPGGQLIVRGYYADPGGSESPFGALFQVHLLLFDRSRDPLPLRALESWIEVVGFKLRKRFALTAHSTCLMATK